MPVGVPAPPHSKQIIAGLPVTFAVGATGPLPITYQWRKNGVPISGATGEVLSIPSVAAGDAASYDVVVTTAGGETNIQPVVLTVMTPPAPGSLTYGLVLHLQFESNYVDTSGLGNVVTPNGSPSFVPGQVGGSAVLVSNNASTVYSSVSANLLDTLAFGPTDNFSVSLWVNYTGNHNDLPWIGNARSSTYQPGWVMTGDAINGGPNCGLDYTLTQAGGGSQLIEDPVPNSPTLNDGNWHHVVLTVDRTNNTNAIAYADGVAFNTNSLATLDGVSFATGYSVTVGSDPTTQYTVSGIYEIDDVGIWNRVLSGTEVSNIFTLGQSGQTYSLTPAVLLTIQMVGAQVQLSWSSGTLQSAPALSGPWAPVPGATAPSYEVTPTGKATFYRVQL
jgi:hypothetical protein